MVVKASVLASISDLDGDGKEDVVIGATRADPGGISGAGSVYIYSSGTGNLIKQLGAVKKEIEGQQLPYNPDAAANLILNLFSNSFSIHFC